MITKEHIEGIITRNENLIRLLKEQQVVDFGLYQEAIQNRQILKGLLKEAK